MNEKIEVGKRFSKRELTIEEHLKIFVGLAAPIDRKSIRDFFETFQNKDEVFSDFLKYLGEFYRLKMQLWRLPCVPYIYKVNGALTLCYEEKPEGWKEENNELCRLTIDQYILHIGYEHDSLQHLAAVALRLIHRIEVARNSRALQLTLLPHMMFELGRIHTLFRVYELESKDGGKGPEVRREVNPFRAYGKRLREKYPEKSFWQIYNKIPRGSLNDESRITEDSMIPEDEDNGFIFIRFNDDGEKKIAAVLDKDGMAKKTIKAESFRKTYFKKPVK